MAGVGIQVGGHVGPEVIEAVVRAATCTPIPEVAIKALEVLATLGNVNGATVSNCQITVPAEPTAPRVVGSDFDDWSESE